MRLAPGKEEEKKSVYILFGSLELVSQTGPYPNLALSSASDPGGYTVLHPAPRIVIGRLRAMQFEKQKKTLARVWGALLLCLLYCSPPTTLSRGYLVRGGRGGKS